MNTIDQLRDMNSYGADVSLFGMSTWACGVDLTSGTELHLRIKQRAETPEEAVALAYAQFKMITEAAPKAFPTKLIEGEIDD